MTQQDPWLAQFEERRKEREQADRSFTVLGEELVVKASVAPEVGLRLAKFQVAMAKYVADFQEAQAKQKPPPTDSGYTDEDMLELSESVIVDCLTPESLEAWQRLRDPARPEPLALLEIYGLAGYVLARASGFPTGGPSASSDGQRNGKSSSQAKSPSRAASRKG